MTQYFWTATALTTNQHDQSIFHEILGIGEAATMADAAAKANGIMNKKLRKSSRAYKMTEFFEKLDEETTKKSGGVAYEMLHLASRRGKNVLVTGWVTIGEVAKL